MPGAWGEEGAVRTFIWDLIRSDGPDEPLPDFARPQPELELPQQSENEAMTASPRIPIMLTDRRKLRGMPWEGEAPVEPRRPKVRPLCRCWRARAESGRLSVPQQQANQKQPNGGTRPAAQGQTGVRPIRGRQCAAAGELAEARRDLSRKHELTPLQARIWLAEGTRRGGRPVIARSSTVPYKRKSNICASSCISNSNAGRTR